MATELETVVVSFADGTVSKDGDPYALPLPDVRGFPVERSLKDYRLFDPFVATPAWKVRLAPPPMPRHVGSLALHEKMSAAHEELRNWCVVVFCIVFVPKSFSI